MLSRKSGGVSFMKKTLDSINQVLTASVIPNTLLINADFPTPDCTRRIRWGDRMMKIAAKGLTRPTQRTRNLSAEVEVIVQKRVD